MGGPFSFLIGALSLGASAGMHIKESEDNYKNYQEYVAQGYNSAVQMRYDCGSRIFEVYNVMALRDKIWELHPHLSGDYCFAAAKYISAKWLMENETKYKYEMPRNFRMLNTNLYKQEDFLRKEEDYYA